MNHQEHTQFSTHIMANRVLVGNIIEVTLACPAQFYWQAGDYLWLGIDETRLKPFSIANVYVDQQSLIVLQISLTDSLNDWWNELTQAQQCMIKGPVSQYHWPTGDKPIYLLAGGTGLTPLLALLIANEAELSERVVSLYWGVSRSELLFAANLLNHFAQTYPRFHWQAIISDEKDDWAGAKGNLPDAVRRVLTSVDDHQWLICGPWPMVKSIKEWLLSQGVNPQDIQ